jgi:hypothetical protein
MRLLIFILMMMCSPSLHAEQFACISTETHGDSKGNVEQYLLEKDRDNYTLEHLFSGVDFKYTAVDTGKHLHLGGQYRNDSSSGFESHNILFVKSKYSLIGLQTILATNFQGEPLSALVFDLECHVIR